MSPERQRIAIAEACGLTPDPVHAGTWIKPGSAVSIQLPDHINDLNAIHKAVMSLQANRRDMFNLQLCDLSSGHFDHSDAHDLDSAINATASQRAEAFLRTIGKWVEEPMETT